MAEATLRQWERQGVGNVAAVVVDRRTNEVLAWVGSTDYFDDVSRRGHRLYRSAALLGKHPEAVPLRPGSERGIITPATLLADLPRGASDATNADKLYLGPLLPRTALANSRHVPAVGLLGRVGSDEAYGLFEQLGLHAAFVPARHYGLGLIVGGLPVTLEQLVRAYTVLSSDGRLGDLVWYRGQKVERPNRIFSEDTARQISLFLSDPMARLPSFPRMGWNEYPFPVAVKTGTSSNYRDAWTVAFSSRYLVGVWVGHPDYHPMSRVSGYRAAAKLTHRIINYLHRDQQDGLEDLGFPTSARDSTVRLCALTGKLATDACDRVSLEYLRAGEEPVAHCDAHIRLAVDTRDGRVASSRTRRSSVKCGRSFNCRRFMPPGRQEPDSRVLRCR